LFCVTHKRINFSFIPFILSKGDIENLYGVQASYRNFSVWQNKSDTFLTFSLTLSFPHMKETSLEEGREIKNFIFIMK
jgi:hypothetical protein